jgi:hypothetical protein
MAGTMQLQNAWLNVAWLNFVVAARLTHFANKLLAVILSAAKDLNP